MERPFVLTDARGTPRQLYLAIHNGKQAYNMTLKLTPGKNKGVGSLY